MSAIKKSILAMWLAAAVLSAHAADPQAPSLAIGQVIAVVNEDVITRHELDERLKIVVRRLKNQGTPLPDHAALEKQVLEGMINDVLLRQAARDNGVRVDDAQLDRQLRALAQQNNMTSLEQFRARLEKEGEDYGKYREELRGQMISNLLREREVDSRLLVSDSEVANYLAVESGQPGRGEEYHVAHIRVSIPDQASAENVQASQKRANEALALLHNGASFAQVAAGHSDAPDAMRGGDLGWVPWDQFPLQFREVLAKMQPGDVSPLLHAPTAYHILKLLDRRRQTETVIITQTHVRHILVKTSDLVPDSEARGRILEIKKRIEHGASFEEQAKLHSEDGAAAQGGDLGWVTPGGEMVPPEFEKAMNSLQPGELSGPVQTGFGWHLIQVLERRNTDVSEEQKLQRARMAIRMIKSEDAWQDWQRQLRDSAHVEYRDESLR